MTTPVTSPVPTERALPTPVELWDAATDAVTTSVADAVTEVVELAATVRPRMRGWLHAAITPLVLTVGVLLVLRAADRTAAAGAAVFAGSSLLLFGVSAVYNIRAWTGPLAVVLQRFDHANIFVLIAGSYTPYGLVLLDGPARTWLLGLAWGGAAAGAVFRIVAPGAPRWLSTATYVGLGWVAVLFAPRFMDAAEPLVLGLLTSGGLLYTAGAVVYARRRPDPWPAWFGFHEVFHVFTVVAFAAHCAGVYAITH